MQLIEHPDRETLIRSVAGRIAAALRRTLADAGRAVLCLPGGATPLPLFGALARARLDWPEVIVLPGDERWVPQDHPRSNAGAIRRRLIDAGAEGARLVPLCEDDSEGPAAGAARASARVAPLLPLSVLLLGMGEDMHTASLFPGATGLAAALDPAAPPVLPIRRGAADEVRVTLSVPALASAQDRLLMITGSAKRAALARAADLPPSEAPVRALWDGLTVHYAP